MPFFCGDRSHLYRVIAVFDFQHVRQLGGLPYADGPVTNPSTNRGQRATTKPSRHSVDKCVAIFSPSCCTSLLFLITDPHVLCALMYSEFRQNAKKEMKKINVERKDFKTQLENKTKKELDIFDEIRTTEP